MVTIYWVSFICWMIAAVSFGWSVKGWVIDRKLRPVREAMANMREIFDEYDAKKAKRAADIAEARRMIEAEELIE